MEEELDVVLKKIKSWKDSGVDEILPEVWKTRKFDDMLLQLRNAQYQQSTIENWMKDCILLFSKKGGLEIIKNYRDIILTDIAAKVYLVLHLNCIQPDVEKILMDKLLWEWFKKKKRKQWFTHMLCTAQEVRMNI